MHTPLQTTVIALLLTTASFSAQAQTTPPPEVIEPDGICAQITIPDPDNPAPATIEVNDETDPDCHTPGIIYQQADDTVIDATVDTTATDWATRCRALGVGTGPVGVGQGAAGQPHTYEDTTRTRVTAGGSTGCIVWTSYARDHGRRYRTVWDCHEGGAHATAEGDGHAHDWLAEPWLPWQWTEVACWTVVSTLSCPPPPPDETDTRGSYSFNTCSGQAPDIDQPPARTRPDPDDPTEPDPQDPTEADPQDPTEPDPQDPTEPNPQDPTEPNPQDPTEPDPEGQEAPTSPTQQGSITQDIAALGGFPVNVERDDTGRVVSVTAVNPPATPPAQSQDDDDGGDGNGGGSTSGGSTSGGAPSDGVPGGYNW